VGQIRQPMVNKSRNKHEPVGHRFSLATIFSLIAVVVSILSYRLAQKALEFNEQSSSPALFATVDLVEPIAVGKEIQTKVGLENFGKTIAKDLHPVLKWSFSRADVAFTPDYTGENTVQGTVSDLPPGGHTTLISTSSVRLLHDHDLNAVLSG